MKTKAELRPHAEALAEDMTKLCGSVIAKGLLGIIEVCAEQQDRIAELERHNAELQNALEYYTTAIAIDTRKCASDGDTIDDGHTARAALAQAKTERPLTKCAAARDGECSHTQCPQLRDDEPKKTGRHCPLDTHEDDRD